MSTAYTDGTYLQKCPTWHIEDSAWKSVQIINMLEKNRILPEEICEIGCGAGEILNILSTRLTHTKKFTGYDISPQAIKMANKIDNSRLVFKNQDLLDLQNIKYELLLIMDVVEHIEHYIEFLKRLKDKGDYKLFHFPLDFSCLTIINSTPLLETRNKVGHLHYFTKDIVLAVLQDLGYKIIDYFYTGSSFVQAPNSIKLKFLNNLRKFLFKINKDLTVKIFGGYSLLILTK